MNTLRSAGKETKRRRSVRPVIGTSIATGEKVRLCGGTEIADAGFNQAAIWRSLCGMVHQHAGFTWEYEDGKPVNRRERYRIAEDDRLLIGTHKETGEVIQVRGEKQCSDMGFKFSHIRAVIAGRRLSHAGYVWRYANEENVNK